MKKVIMFVITCMLLAGCGTQPKNNKNVVLDLEDNVKLAIVYSKDNVLPIDKQIAIAKKLAKKLHFRSERVPIEPNFGILFTRNKDGTIDVRVTIVGEWKGHKKGINAGFYTVDDEGNIIKDY